MGYEFNNNNNSDSKKYYTVIDLDTITIPMDQGTIVANNEIYVCGKKIPNPPCNINNTIIINDRVYVNGYEFKNGKWKKTFAAWWHKYF